MPKPKKKKAISLKTLQNRMDVNWSKAVKIAANYTCQMCQTKKEDLGGKQVLNSHHIVSRKYKNYRWDLANGCCLCYRCHKWFAHGDDYIAQMEWSNFVDYHSRWITHKYGSILGDIIFEVRENPNSIKPLPMDKLHEIDAALKMAVK